MFVCLTTVCGQRYYNLQTDQIIYLTPNTTFNTNLNIPTYANDVTCTYIISKNEKESGLLALRILHFDLEKDFDFVLIGTGSSPSDVSSILAKLTGRPKLRTLTSTHSEVWLTFVTDSSGVSSGYEIDIYLYVEDKVAGIMNLYSIVSQLREESLFVRTDRDLHDWCQF